MILHSGNSRGDSSEAIECLKEKQFDKAYAENKAQVTSKAYIAQFKKRVAAILEKKQSIQEAEKNNVAIMRVRASKSKEQIF